MNYWQFRHAVYRDELKQWLLSIKQMSLGLVALFPLALPALLYMALTAWGIVAEPDTPVSLFHMTLWAYLLLVYSCIYLQRNAITGSSVSFYDQSLSVPKWQRHTTQWILIFNAGNVLFAGPMVLLVLVLNKHVSSFALQSLSFTFSDLLPLTSMVGLSVYYGHCALSHRFPWLSLLIIPIAAFFGIDSASKPTIVAAYVIGIVAERHWQIRPISLPQWLNGLLFLYVKSDVAQPSQNMMRWVCGLILSLIAYVFIREVHADVRFASASFFSFVIAVLLASKCLDLVRLHDEYGFYLQSLCNFNKRMFVYSCFYCLLITLPVCLLIAAFDIFEASHWIMFTVFWLGGVIGIHWMRKQFLLVPLGLVLVVWLVLRL